MLLLLVCWTSFQQSLNGADSLHEHLTLQLKLGLVSHVTEAVFWGATGLICDGKMA